MVQSIGHQRRNFSVAHKQSLLALAPNHSVGHFASSTRSLLHTSHRSRKAVFCPITASLSSSTQTQQHTPESAAPTSNVQQFDFLVLGSGIAGLTYALKVAEYGRVAVVTKASADEGCTVYAQGGICAVLDQNDSVNSHVHDTMVAGAFLNDVRIVDLVCREGPAHVLELVDFGARFTRTSAGDLHLTREGGHSARRIVHAADATGAEVQRALLAAAHAHPSITFFENHLALDLVTTEIAGVRHALGADVFDQTTSKPCRFLAPVTMLATGGGGQVFPNTTNSAVATGDGMAMAYRARAAVANMEFVQFHPTALYRPACPAFENGPSDRYGLVTEAVRGEGGLLYNVSGHRFMPQYHDRAELAPRDIVSRAIHREMTESGSTHVLLDISHKRADDILAHFPNVAAQCAAAGVDITREPIPVAPAQHYMCGGVLTGDHGQTNIAGLYACGEVACSGLHGANRLASNSLLEGLVFGNRAVVPSVAHAERIAKHGTAAMSAAISSTDFTGTRAPRPLTSAASAWVAAKRRELRDIMWRAAGIVRTEQEMKTALQAILRIDVDVSDLSASAGLNPEITELRNLVTVGELIMSSALDRKESRGGHYRADYPESMPHEQLTATVIHPGSPRGARKNNGTAQVQPFGGGSFIGKRSGASRQLSMTRSLVDEE